jgi:DNA invertase Pin-like site-specific DNA recombinase
VNARARVLGYARVSTVEQAQTGYSLDAQATAICGECERRGWALLETIVDEGESGGSLDRPGLERALEAIAHGDASGLVVAKLDRLSRSVVDFARLVEWFEREADATLVALDLGVDTSSPGGRLVANVFASVAQWERETIGVRTRIGLAAARANGMPISRPAVADDPELHARIAELRGAGMTLQAIADLLNNEGVPTLRGAIQWRPSSIQAATGYRRRNPRAGSGVLPAASRRRKGPRREG